MGLLESYLFPPPPSLYLSAMSLLSFISCAVLGLLEVLGRHVKYSKFWNHNASKEDADVAKVPTRPGMLFTYSPAFAISAVSLAVVVAGGGSLRACLLSLVLSLHFCKRVLEVLFVHKYSGNMTLDTAIQLPLSYLLFTITSLYSQHLADEAPQPPTDLKYIGLALFLVGIGGNFYHHFLLSKLRSKDDGGYKIPKGGFFNLVICPHYFFEIVGFVGVSCISQTVYTFSFTLGSALYLMGRSYATRRWYLAKFPNFPREIKALIPYVI